MRAALIRESGSIEEIEETASILETATQLVAEWTSVVVLTCPLLGIDGEGMHIGIIDDFGAQDRPQNPIAWALYGRGPIFGPMILARDDGRDLSDELIEMIRLPLIQWPWEDPQHAQRVAELVTAEAERPPMLIPRPGTEGE